ncbi:glycosyltransferase family 2 protein [Thalassotalea montiporae]
MFKISIVVPVFGSPDSLRPLYERVAKVMTSNNWAYELIMVNDSCPHNSWQHIRALCDHDQSVKGVNLSRNFGQHYAISAGLAEASGDVAIVMDCDLQDRPEEIPKLVNAMSDENDIVFGRSTIRGKESFLTQITSKAFYKIFSVLTENRDFSFNVSFVAMSRKAYTAINQLEENKRLFLGLLQYVGFRYVVVDVEHDERFEGESSYNFFSRLAMAFRGITNSSTKLLRAGIGIGMLSSFSSFVYGVYLIYTKLMYDATIPGWTSSIVSTFFVGGVVMVLIGILGLYIEVIFWEVKNRPAYFVKEKRNLNGAVKNVR